MKKTIFSLMLGAIVALTSCNSSDDGLIEAQNGGNQLATFTVEAPTLTRAAVTTGLSRYIVEAYEGVDLTATPQRVESSTGSLSVTLKKNTDYTFLFWADNGSAYTVTDLTAVTPADASAIGTPAYCLAKTFNSADFSANATITLKNATAQVNFIESFGFEHADNTLTVKYPNGVALNVGTGKVSDVAGEITHTFTGIAKAAANETLATDYVLAPLSAQNVVNMKVQLNTEAEKEIDNVPFQMSFKTNIKGEYSNIYASTFTISNEVEDYTNNPDYEFPPKAKVGDYYYSDNTFSTEYNNEKTCVGIVYWVGDPSTDDAALRTAYPGCTHGLVVALTECEAVFWQSTPSDVNSWITENETDYAPIVSSNGDNHPINKIMGYNNTKAIEAFNAAEANRANKVDVIEKIVAYRTIAVAPAGTSDWFLPSMKELTLLCGLENQTANIYNNSFGTGNRDDINTKLSVVTGATQIKEDYYWSSTERSDVEAWYVDFEEGSTGCPNKNDDTHPIRAVFAF